MFYCGEVQDRWTEPLKTREVKTLIKERQTVGVYTTSFEPSGLAAGIYFVRMEIASLDMSPTVVKSMKLVFNK